MTCQGAQPSRMPARICQENAKVQNSALNVILTQGAFTLDAGLAPVPQARYLGLSPLPWKNRKFLGTKRRKEKNETYVAAAQRTSLNSLFHEASDTPTHSISRICFLHNSLSRLLLQAFSARKHCPTLPVKSRSCHWNFFLQVHILPTFISSFTKDANQGLLCVPGLSSSLKHFCLAFISLCQWIPLSRVIPNRLCSWPTILHLPNTTLDNGTSFRMVVV